MLSHDKFIEFMTCYTKDNKAINYGTFLNFVNNFDFKKLIGENKENTKNDVLIHIAKYKYLYDKHTTYTLSSIPIVIKQELNIDDNTDIDIIYKKDNEWYGVKCIWGISQDLINDSSLLSFSKKFKDIKLKSIVIFSNRNKKATHYDVNNIEWFIKSNLVNLLNGSFIKSILDNNFTKPEKKVITIATKKTRHTTESVKNEFSKFGYTLIDEYKPDTPLKYKCDKGHEDTMRPKDFYKGHRCKTCSIITTSENSKLPFKNLKAIFDKLGYTLITTENEYKNANTQLKYICDKNHNNSMTYKQFSVVTNKCKNCIRVKSAEREIMNIDIVKKICDDMGFVLVDTVYITKATKINMICNKNHKICITVDKLRGKNPCPDCSNKHGYKKSIDDLKNEATKHGYVLHSNSFKKQTDRLDYTCPNGHDLNISYKQWVESMKTPNKCGRCARLKSGSIQRHDYEFVTNEFKKKGYELLTTYYNNAHQLLKFKCDNDHVVELKFDDFYNNHRECYECVIKSTKGELAIENYLKSIGCSNYMKEKSFPDCKYINLLRFDMYVNDEFLIEYDGEQHFFVCEFFGGRKNFEKTIERDIIKTKYCIANKIPLLRISYREFNQIHSLIENFMNYIKTHDKSKPYIQYSNDGLYDKLIKKCKV